MHKYEGGKKILDGIKMHVVKGQNVEPTSLGATSVVKH